MLEITDFDYKGRGIGKIDGKIVFVENSIPGEIIDIDIVKDEKKYVEGVVKRYINKSNNRITPECPYYKYCGGCSLMHLNYKNQLIYKQNKVENIIKKALNSKIPVNKIVKSEINTYYRNKVTFQVNNDIGFFKNESHEFISIDSCIMCNKKINSSIPYLKKLKLSEIQKITCRCNDNKLMIIIETNNKKINIDCLKNISDSIYLLVNEKYIHKYGEKHLFESIGNYKYIISPDSFFQINIDVTKKIYDRIKEYIGFNKNIIDLYCGTGTIGIYTSEKNNVIGIEVNKYAYQDALKNKELNNIQNIEFLCGDSGKSIKKILFKPDVIIVDPPRGGLNKETINNILMLNPKKLIYVSCNPLTLASDLKYIENNYKIVEISPFDMFPNTYHVETVCLLNRKAI